MAEPIVIEMNGEEYEFPAGTSDEVIKKALSKIPKPNTQTASAEQFAPKPDESQLVNAPSTVGFIKNIGRNLMEQGKGALENAAAVSHRPNPFVDEGEMGRGPEKIVDFIKGKIEGYKPENAVGTIYNKPAEFLEDVAGVASLRGPIGEGVGAVKRGIGRVAEPAMAVAKGAALETPVFGRMAKGGIRAYQKYKKGLPAPKAGMAEGFDQFMPNKGGGGGAAPSGASTSRIPYGPSGEPPSPPLSTSKNAGGVLREGSGAREIDIEEILRQAMEEDAVKGVELPPEPGITAAGKEGEFASSGRPAVNANRYGQMQEDMGLGEAADKEWWDTQAPPRSRHLPDDAFKKAMEEDPQFKAHQESSVGKTDNRYKPEAVGDEEIYQRALDKAVEGNMKAREAGLGGRAESAGLDDPGVELSMQEIMGKPLKVGAEETWDLRSNPAYSAERPIKVSSLEPGQDAVSSGVIDNYAARTTEPPSIEVHVNKMGDPIIYDGHHRVAAAIKNNREMLPANITADEGYTNRLQYGDPNIPEEWHSGAEPGSPDAAIASKLHRDEAMMNQMYRRLLEDPTK